MNLLSRAKANPATTLVLVAVLFFGIIMAWSFGGIAWVRHLANGALRGIASTISDIDKVEGKNQALEQAVGELARQTQELQVKADAERKLRLELQAQKEHAENTAAIAARSAENLRQADLNRVPVTTLEGARDAINRALLSRRHQ